MEVIPIVGISIWSIAKIFVIIALAIYLIFALVIVRQVQLMTNTVEVGFETPVRVISYIHLFFAIAVLIFAFIIL